MSSFGTLVKVLVLSSGLALAMAPVAQAADSGHTDGGGHTDGHGGSGSKGKGPKYMGGQSSTDGAMGGSDSMGRKIFRAPVSSAEDSDRPAWAGVKGGKAGGGGKPIGAGTKKGDLFGDMVIILRNANGEPILVNGLVQVVAFIYDSSGNLIPLTNPDGSLAVIPYNAEGDLMTTVTIGETTYTVYPAEVDLGRLSVGRAPTKVLDHALAEALAKLTATGAVVTLDATGRLVVNGVTIDSPLENLALYDAYLSGKLTVALPTGFNPASLLAAAADKTGAINVDTVIYMNSILGINNLAADPDVYYDFSSYNYDRFTTWSSVNVTVLVLQPNGSYLPMLVNVYDTLFDADADGDGDNWVDPTAVGGADDFANAANDYLQVIEFVHDNAVR